MSTNTDVVRRGFDAFAAGDTAALREVFDPGIAWHMEGRSAISGDYEGVDAVFGFFGSLGQLSGGTFTAELLECGEIAPDLVACLIHRRGAMPAGAVDQRTVLMFQMRDGRAVDVTEYALDMYAYDEAVGPKAIALPDARTPAVAVTS